MDIKNTAQISAAQENMKGLEIHGKGTADTVKKLNDQMTTLQKRTGGDRTVQQEVESPSSESSREQKRRCEKGGTGDHRSDYPGGEEQAWMHGAQCA